MCVMHTAMHGTCITFMLLLTPCPCTRLYTIVMLCMQAQPAMRQTSYDSKWNASHPCFMLAALQLHQDLLQLSAGLRVCSKKS